MSDDSDGMMNPFEDLAEDGEEEMDDYDEEGEMDMDDMEMDGEEGEQEISEDISDVSSTLSKDKPLPNINLVKPAKQQSNKHVVQLSESESEESDNDLPQAAGDSDDSAKQRKQAKYDASQRKEFEEVQAMTNEEFEQAKLEKFALKAINNKDAIRVRLHEIKQSFYNRLESKKLIKKTGKIPFTEHMTVTHAKPLAISEGAAQLQINDDIKREHAFYNSTRDNVMKAMTVCV